MWHSYAACQQVPGGSVKPRFGCSVPPACHTSSVSISSGHGLPSPVLVIDFAEENYLLNLRSVRDCCLASTYPKLLLKGGHQALNLQILLWCMSHPCLQAMLRRRPCIHGMGHCAPVNCKLALGGWLNLITFVCRFKGDLSKGEASLWWATISENRVCSSILSRGEHDD